MNVQTLGVTQAQAQIALAEYKAHRATYDKRDWEIERIYRQIAKGRTIISAFDAIRTAGVDEEGRPRLALMRADQQACRCWAGSSQSVTFTNEHNSRAREWHFELPWPNRSKIHSYASSQLVALLPRIPPQHRPPQGAIADYHLLWEASWISIPRDPYLLKRIGRDAWVVLAAWDLTAVEMNVLRSHRS